MLDHSQLTVVAYQVYEDGGMGWNGELICEKCFFEGRVAGKPVIRYTLDEMASEQAYDLVEAGERNEDDDSPLIFCDFCGAPLA